MDARFVHLHTHSHYSLLNALPKIPDLVSAAKKCGMPALALTDSGNLYGAIEFYKECKKQDIKPIIGVDGYLANRSRLDKEPSVDLHRSRLVLLATNLVGYHNLIKLTSAANLEGFYEKPRMDREILEKWHEGLIAIIPSFSGETSGALRQKDFARAKEIIDWYQAVFGKDHVYLEITHHPEFAGHDALKKNTIEFGKQHDIPLVAAHDVYYLSKSDRAARHVLQRIQNAHERGMNEEAEDFSFISQEVAERYFKDMPEALKNTVRIAERCNLDLTLGTWTFPDIKTASGKSHEEELRFFAYQGIEERGLEKTEALVTRLEYELSIIFKKGFAPYFLTVSDLLRFSRKAGILTTTRGSAAGSLVSFLTGITNVNPLEYKLPFERFLNPERPSAPDVDMDFADDRRDEVIAYAKERYGEANVAQIGTFGTMMARAAVRDTARALGYPYGVGDKIAKLIPIGSQGFPMTIDNAMGLEPELKKLYKTDEDAREIIDLAKKIEGNARHISIHAAGVVIAPLPLTDFVPLQFDPKGGKIVTQYDMYSVEEAGLLKFDFLGIRNLAILADSVKLAEEINGIRIDIENAPLDDTKTFEMLARGETEGLFQLNGAGMTRFLKELKPTTIHDINAMVALYRPGPMEVIPQYIERKNNPSRITFLDPRMKKYLEESYGLIVYQDDLLFSAIELAGYSWLEADKFRKAVGKKIPEEMAAQKKRFLEGVVANGQTPAFADMLWKLFEPFQSYGFNKAHAASYGRVAYQTAYMKANFPVEYMTALLTAESGDIDTVSTYVAECKRMGLEVLPPDVNESDPDFTVVDTNPKNGRIRFGLSSIKNFGKGISQSIIDERNAAGPFTSLADFLSRVGDRNLNKKGLESLIKSGAFDSLEERGIMLGNIDRLLEYHKESASKPEHQDSLFGATIQSATLALEPKPEATHAEKLAWEKELLGIYVSGHPLDKYREILAKRESIEKMKSGIKEGMPILIAGIIQEAKILLTKGGEKMAFIRVADFTDSFEAVVFPRTYKEHGSTLVQESCVALKGRVSSRNGTPSMIVEAVKQL